VDEEAIACAGLQRERQRERERERKRYYDISSVDTKDVYVIWEWAFQAVSKLWWLSAK
jgi:hypothetical protein